MVKGRPLMRIAFLLAPTLAPLLAAACASDRAGAGSSVPPAVAQACDGLGLTPGTAEFARCEAGERKRENAAERGVMDTLFRDVTVTPAR
jgi:hypothetical protein